MRVLITIAPIPPFMYGRTMNRDVSELVVQLMMGVSSCVTRRY